MLGSFQFLLLSGSVFLDNGIRKDGTGLLLKLGLKQKSGGMPSLEDHIITIVIVLVIMGCV